MSGPTTWRRSVRSHSSGGCPDCSARTPLHFDLRSPGPKKMGENMSILQSWNGDFSRVFSHQTRGLKSLLYQGTSKMNCSKWVLGPQYNWLFFGKNRMIHLYKPLQFWMPQFQTSPEQSSLRQGKKPPELRGGHIPHMSEYVSFRLFSIGHSLLLCAFLRFHVVMFYLHSFVEASGITKNVYPLQVYWLYTRFPQLCIHNI